METLQTLLLTPYGSLMAILAVLVVGELVAKLTKGVVPMALTVTVLLLALFWTHVFPAEIVSATGISATLFSLVAALLVANLGTLINKKEMAAQWRTVVIALMGIAAIIVICLTIGAAIFGWDNAVAAAPPLTGAAIATAMVRQAAEAVGNTEAVLVAVVCMSMQGIVGYPLTALCLRKEAKKLSAAYKRGELKAPVVEDDAAAGAKKAESTNLVLLKLCAVAFVSYLLQLLTTKLGFSISLYVWALILGFIGAETGFLSRDSLTRANCQGFCMAILMVYLFGGLASSDMSTILAAAKIAIVLVLLAAAGMALMSLLGAKLFKKSFWISYAITLNAFLGFPINVMLTNEALDINTSDPDERAAVSAELMPTMLIASFVCVTIVSVIVAGVLVKFIH